MKFSIITTYHAREDFKAEQIKRCLRSIYGQSYQDYEHIIVDDGSTIDCQKIIEKFPKTKFIKTVHNERVVAMNLALKNATGDWICFLDSDDEFFSFTLEIMKQMIEKNPKYRMFNASSYHIWSDWSGHLRGPFRPKKLKKGHERFGRGQIVNGTYFFHKSVYDKLGAFPGDENGLVKGVDCSEINYGDKRDLYVGSPWDFSAAAQLEFPEIRDLFMVNHEAEPYKIIAELGNPWGQDYYLFYKYTRKYHSKPYDIPIYIVQHDEKSEGEQHAIR